MPNLKKIDVSGWLSTSKHPIIDLAEAHGISLRQIADAIGFNPPNPTKYHDHYFRSLFNGWQYLGKGRIERIRELLVSAGAKSEWVSWAIMYTKALGDKKYRVLKQKQIDRRKKMQDKIVPFNP